VEGDAVSEDTATGEAGGGREQGGGAASGGGVVPPAVLASPSDVAGRHASGAVGGVGVGGHRVPWWRPGWRDVVRHMPWWWWVLSVTTVAAGLSGLAALLVPLGGSRWFLAFLVAGQTLPYAVPAGVALAGYALARGTRMRRDPFCIHCGYSLAGHEPTGTCPECGWAFDRNLVEEFKKDPEFLRHRWEATSRLPASGPVVKVPEGARRRKGDGT
jgi:hypothetical protein